MNDKFVIVKKYIDEYDYYSLLEDGAPEDEFDSEARKISDLIDTDSSIERIAEVIAMVMRSAFGNVEQTENYLETAGKIKSELTCWWNEYQSLDLCNGNINFISDDDEDMIEIAYDDGMFIDVGKYDNGCYYVTVVATNDESGWANPICRIAVSDKKDLIEKIQETIFKFRK